MCSVVAFNGVIMDKKVVSKEDYAKFVRQYTIDNGHQRFGQSFINYFYSEIKDFMPDPSVFYEPDFEKSKYYVEIKYVKDS